MLPVISWPVQATATASSSGGAVGVEQTDHSSLSHNANLYENETDHLLDPNLANIIFSAVSNIKSNLYANSKKKPRSRKVKDPCSVCSKNVSKNQIAIQCSEHQLWSHASCNGIGKSQYAKLTVESDEVPWFFILCLILANSEIFPFGFYSKTDLCDLLRVDLPSEIELLTSFEITSKLTNLPNLSSCDLDENLVQTINSKYYKAHELGKLNVTSQINNCSLFHVNIRSLTKHFEELHSLLYSCKIPFDVIGIFEFKQPVNKNFLTNVNLHEYQLHFQPTKSACSGVAMYVKKSLDHKVLNHVNALEDEFETLWIEVNTRPKCENIIVCCTYRHLDTDANKFIEYLESTCFQT